jgi:hypothetical protein
MKKDWSPCPFCKSEKGMFIAYETTGEMYVKCGKCGGTGPSAYNREDVINLWCFRKENADTNPKTL